MTSTSARLFAAFAFASIVVGRSAPGEAAPIVITDVRVTIGPETYTATSVGWTFPRTLNSGQDLVLTQSLNDPPTTTTSYNFDTSDVTGAANIAQISITVNGSVTTVFTDTGQVLNTKGVDVPNNFTNEAQLYSLLGGPPGLGYQVFVGYADNTHTDACGVWATSVGLAGSSNCLPQVFNGLNATTVPSIFDGAGGINPPQLTQTLPFHCDGTGQTANCYEGGVIRILNTTQQVPEPATTVLLLTGGAVLLTRRHVRSKRTRA